MYAESVLINLIKTGTGYTVGYTEDTSVDVLGADYTIPKVYVGHMGIKLQHPEDMYANGYSELENPEVLVTSIQFICKRSMLHTVRMNIRASYLGFSPFPNDSNYSSVFFMDAQVIAKANDNIWWQELIGLVIPRVS